MIYLRKQFIICTVFLFSIPFNLMGENPEKLVFEISPKLNVYDKDDYQAEKVNWDVSIDIKGRTFFANNKGLLEYDGERWKLYPTESSLRSVFAKGDTIYVGGIKFAGYYTRENNGLTFHKLEQLPTEYQDYWKIYEFDDEIVYQTFSKLYFINSSNKIKSFNTSFTTYSYASEKNIFYHIVDENLHSYTPITSSEKTIASVKNLCPKIQFIHSINNDSILLGDVYKGLFLFEKGIVKPIKNNLSDLLKRYRINKGIPLENGYYAFGTFDGGVIVGDIHGTIKYHININNGLFNNRIHGLAYQNGSLWIATGNGVAVANLTLPLQFMKDPMNKLGKIMDIIKADHNQYYIATNKGVFRGEISSENYVHYLELIEETRGQAWKFIKIDNEIFLGHSDGLFQILDNKINKITNIKGITNIIPTPYDSSIFIGNTFTGLCILQKNEEQWEVINNHFLGGIIPRDIFSISSTEILISAFNRELYLIKLSNEHTEIEEIKKLHNTTELSNAKEIRIGNLNSLPLILTGTSKKYIYKNNKLDSLPSPWNYATFASDIIDNKQLILRNNSLELVDNNTFKKLPSSIALLGSELIYQYENITVFDDSLFCFLLTDGLSFINIKELPIQEKTEVPIEIISTQFSDKKTNQNAVIENLNEVPFQFNSVAFLFTDFDWEDDSRYQYKLKNYQDNWFETNKGEVAFQNLSNGTYTFMVRKNEGELIQTISFKILPPWYASSIAYLIYFVLFIVLSWFIFKLHQTLLRKQKFNLLLAERQKLNQLRLQNNNRVLTQEKKVLNQQVHHSEDKLSKLLIDKEQQEELINRINNEIKNIEKEQYFVKPTGLKKIHKIIEKNSSPTKEALLFEHHDRFFFALKSKHPNLKEDDIKLCGYLLMSKSSKEIAPLFHITERSVELKRYRLRKKIGLPKGDSLLDYLKSI